MRTVLFLVLLLLCSSTGLFTQSTLNAPKVINNPDPEYPAEAAGLGYGGRVVVFVTINKIGSVAIRNAFGPIAPCSDLNDKRGEKIRKAVLEAAKQLQFEPPLQDGKPTEIGMSVIYAFDEFGKPVHGRISSGKVIDAGVLQGRVKYLARPEYPSSARASRASGAVPVDVLVDLDGKVIAAAAVGGHPLLGNAAAQAACASNIEPESVGGKRVQVSGTITYVFVP